MSEISAGNQKFFRDYNQFFSELKYETVWHAF